MSKPNALPLQLLCDQANVLPSNCIVVGDTISDTGMAINAGAGLCVGVLTGSGTRDQLLMSGALNQNTLSIERALRDTPSCALAHTARQP